mmetsp:Transcript_25260/g.45442  ORF Transcript_25260/g.45442 Transcript_25260/m.45442 type:complete len:263 (+) Transcript_25260:195-983(+)
MQLLKKLLHIPPRHLHYIRIKTIKPKHALHAFCGQLEILPKLILHDIPRFFGVFVPHHHVGVGAGLFGEEYEGAGFGSRPFAIFAMHVHEEVSEFGEDEGFGEDVVVCGGGRGGAVLLGIVGCIVVIGSHYLSAAGRTASSTAPSAGRRMKIRIPKMTQSRNGIPIHKVPRSGHNVPLQRHGQPNPSAQSRSSSHVAAIDEVREIAALHAAFHGGECSSVGGGGGAAVGVEGIESDVEGFDHFSILAIFFGEHVVVVGGVFL